MPVAFSSYSYLALNSLAEGDATRLRYLEMTKAEQFQPSVRGFDTRFVPLFLYRLRALDTMWAHLTAGAPLPESQVVRTSPRGGEPGSAPALEASNVPPVPTQAAIPDQSWCGQDGSTFRIDAQFTGANVCFAQVVSHSSRSSSSQISPTSVRPSVFVLCLLMKVEQTSKRRTLCSRFLPEATIEPRLTGCGRLKALGKVDPPRRLPQFVFQAPR